MRPAQPRRLLREITWQSSAPTAAGYLTAGCSAAVIQGVATSPRDLSPSSSPCPCTQHHHRRHQRSTNTAASDGD